MILFLKSTQALRQEERTDGYIQRTSCKSNAATEHHPSRTMCNDWDFTFYDEPVIFRRIPSQGGQAAPYCKGLRGERSLAVGIRESKHHCGTRRKVSEHSPCPPETVSHSGRDCLRKADLRRGRAWQLSDGKRRDPRRLLSARPRGQHDRRKNL